MEPREDLKRELQDPEFAKFYGADQARIQLALTLVATRSKLGLKQKEIAAKLGASQPYIAKLEKGDANPTIGKIGSMLALLDFRLVTRSAPLLPEPTKPMTGFVGAASVTEGLEDAGAGASFEGRLHDQPPSTHRHGSAVAGEALDDWSPTRRSSSPRAVTTGGAV